MPESTNYATVREALFYEKTPDNKTKCSLCERRCKIPPGGKGYCGTRMNIDGKLYNIVYGDISAIESRPIEAKPFYHYWPGSTALTFSTWSCNMDCAWCQNFHLSKMQPEPSKTLSYPPEKVVEAALYNCDDGLSASFQEPTLLAEWAIPTFKLAKRKGLKYCCYVSNGYMTLDVLNALCEAGMDGLKVDVKGDAGVYEQFCGGADVEKVWRNVKEAKRLGTHVEVVNLVVSGVNDDEGAIKWLVVRHLKEAGAEAPLHFTKYIPAYKFDNPPTKTATLETAYDLAKKEGVLFPYVGNVEGHRYAHTYCPDCGDTLIKRSGNRVVKYSLTRDKKCPKCGAAIPLVGKFVTRFNYVS